MIASRVIVRAMLLGSAAALAVGCSGPRDFAPQGDVPDAPDAFVWPATKAASAYVIQLFAADGGVLFESPRLERARFEPDEELRARLREVGRFEWRVRIYDGDRIAGHSDRYAVNIAG